MFLLVWNFLHEFEGVESSIVCLPFGIGMLYKGTASEIFYGYLASTVWHINCNDSFSNVDGTNLWLYTFMWSKVSLVGIWLITHVRPCLNRKSLP